MYIFLHVEIAVIKRIKSSLPIFFLCFLKIVGAWSDTHGRKAVLILPFIGNILSFLIYIANFYWFDVFSSNHLLWGSVAGATGGYVCLNIGLYGYVSDVTNAENRTTRLSILNGVFSAGYVIGVTLGGKLYKYYQNFYLNFILSIICGILGIIYSIAFVKESIKKEDHENPKGFFDFQNVRDSLKTAFKPRPGHARANIIVLIVNFAIFMFCLNTVHYDYLLVIKR